MLLTSAENDLTLVNQVFRKDFVDFLGRFFLQILFKRHFFMGFGCPRLSKPLISGVWKKARKLRDEEASVFTKRGTGAECRRLTARSYLHFNKLFLEPLSHWIFRRGIELKISNKMQHMHGTVDGRNPAPPGI